MDTIIAAIISGIVAIILAYFTYRSKLEKILDKLDAISRHEKLSAEHKALSGEHHHLAEDHRLLLKGQDQLHVNIKETGLTILSETKQNFQWVAKISDELFLQKGRYESLADKTKGLSDAAAAIRGAADDIASLTGNNRNLQTQLLEKNAEIEGLNQDIQTLSANYREVAADYEELLNAFLMEQRENELLRSKIEQLTNPPQAPKGNTTNYFQP